MKKLSLILGSLILCEIIARLVLPPVQTVKVKRKLPEFVKLPQAVSVEDDGHINSLLDWSGHYGVRLRPNVSVTVQNHMLSHRDVLIETNSLGLRAPELRNDGRRRILILGDSITLADFLNEEDSFPGRIQAKLGPGMEILNGGLPGASTRDEYYFYEEIAAAVKPDTVVLAMYLNDVADSMQFYAWTLPGVFSKSRLLSFAFERLQILELLAKPITPPGIDPNWAEAYKSEHPAKVGDFFHDRQAFNYEIYNASRDFGLAWNADSWKILTEMIAIFKASVEQAGSRFAIVLLPVHMQVMGSVIDTYPQDQFRAMCEDLGIKCLDPVPALRQALEPKSLYFDHCHMTEYGNDLLANQLAEWLR